MLGEQLGRFPKEINYEERYFSRSWFIALLNGKRWLFEAYWVLGLAVNFIVVMTNIIFNDSWGIFSVILNIIFSCMIIFWSVAVWRCAPNVNNNFWCYLARMMAILSIPVFMFNLFL